LAHELSKQIAGKASDLICFWGWCLFTESVQGKHHESSSHELRSTHIHTHKRRDQSCSWIFPSTILRVHQKVWATEHMGLWMFTLIYLLS